MPDQQEISDAQIAMMLAGRDRLAAYAVAQYAWFEVARHHKILFDHLEALERGDILKLMVFQQPQTSKTTSCSELFPSWCLGKHPDWRVIAVSYNQPRADDFGGQIRWLLQTDYHRAIFPDCRLNPDTQAKDDFELLPVKGRPKGACRAAGRQASITGLPADLIVLDDLQKDQDEARSPAVQREIRKLMNTVIDARMHPHTRLLVPNTRWDPDDFAGWELGEHPDGWVVLELPALGKWTADLTDEERAALPEAERDKIRIADEINGDSMWPERYPKDFLLKKRDRLLRDEWLAVYQQRPTRDGDETVFQSSWFKTISRARLYDVRAEV
jgi:hypothetical protein